MHNTCFLIFKTTFKYKIGGKITEKDEFKMLVHIK